MSAAPPRAGSQPRFSVSMPVLLVLLSFAVLVPLIGFSLFSLREFAASVRGIDREIVAERAQSLSANVDREIAGLASAGAALAASPTLAAGDYRRFHDEAKLAMLYARANVLLLDLSLQQLVNTRVPFGTALPESSAPPETLDVIETKTLHVSDVFLGKVARQRVFNVSLPVIIDGKAGYVLVITAEPPRLDELLRQQALPEGWHAAVSDRGGTVFASNLPALPFARFDMAAGSPGLASNVTILEVTRTLKRHLQGEEARLPKQMRRAGDT